MVFGDGLVFGLTIYQVICVLGIPSLGTIVGFLYRKLRKVNEEERAVMLGVQALLRAQMINDYNKWSERHYAPLYARENFENCWKQYHALGANGVMDDIHEKFLALPTEKPE